MPRSIIRQARLYIGKAIRKGFFQPVPLIAGVVTFLIVQLILSIPIYMSATIGVIVYFFVKSLKARTRRS